MIRHPRIAFICSVMALQGPILIKKGKSMFHGIKGRTMVNTTCPICQKVFQHACNYKKLTCSHECALTYRIMNIRNKSKERLDYNQRYNDKKAFLIREENRLANVALQSTIFTGGSDNDGFVIENEGMIL